MQDSSIKVINLPSKALTETEQSFLGKWLKFTPTPQKSNSQELKEDLAAFTQKVRPLEYFDGIEDNDDDSLVRNKGEFTPPKTEIML